MFNYSINVQKLHDSIEEERNNRYESFDPYHDDYPCDDVTIPFEDTLWTIPE